MLAGLNGKVSLAALGSYSSSAIDSSVVQVVTPVVGDVTDSVLVFVAFGGVWAVGIMGILYLYWKDSIKVSIDSFPTLHENKSVREATIDYLYMVLPVSLQVENWWVARIWHILSIKHKWLSILRILVGLRSDGFVNESIDRQQRRNALDIVHVGTSLTVSCFVVALFYDLQSPVDDGYCGQLLDKNSCRARSSILDQAVKKWIWIDPPIDLVAAIVTQSSSVDGKFLSSAEVTAEVGYSSKFKSCRLNENTLSTRAYLLTFIITSLFTMLIMHVVDLVFEVLHSQPKPVSSFRTKETHPETALHACASTETKSDESVVGQLWLPIFVSEMQTVWRRISAASEVDQGQPLAHDVLGVVILQALLLDILSQSLSNKELQILHHVFLRWFPEKRYVSTEYWQYGMWIVLFLINCGALVFLLYKAAIRGYHWQVKFFRAAMSEALLDIFFIQVVEIVLLGS
jgi:hypothetical protein